MEIVICMFLASLVTGIRPVSDLIHLMRGQEPPHLAKARIRAEREKERLAARQARAENRQPRPADGKPTLGDVARVYWGDALQDVIDSHDRKRAEKQAQRQENQTAAAEQRPATKVRPSRKSRAARLLNLLVRPVGNRDPETQPATEPDPTTQEEPEQPENLSDHYWTCEYCGVRSVYHENPADAKREGQAHYDFVHAHREDASRRQQPAAGREAPDRCPRCDTATTITPSGLCEPCTKRMPHGFCPRCSGAVRLYDGQWIHGPNWHCTHTESAADHTVPCTGCGTQLPMHPFMASLGMQVQCRACRTARTDPKSSPASEQPEGETVTETTATGDAYDLESASQQCELIGDDLTRIDASLDVIDEAIASAGAATELVEAFLKSKNVDDTTIGGMAVARDMLSPERIKALMDAVAAAKAGLRATKEALDAMNDAAAEALNGADGSVVNGR